MCSDALNNCGSLFHTHGGEQLLGTPLLSLNLAQLAEHAHANLLQVVLGEVSPARLAQHRFHIHSNILTDFPKRCMNWVTNII